MKTAMVNLLWALSVSAMVALAITGIYIIGEQSRANPIVAPQKPAIKKAPPKPKQPPKRYIRPSDFNPDSPAPK